MLLFLSLLYGACSEPDSPLNPFLVLEETNPTHTDSLSQVEYPADHFVSLHYRIFKPTCATSGCHDGNFEPDFRTLESSYNTLVYHPLIKNDLRGNFQFRVWPGKPDESVLYHRLTEDIDGQSGLMPLVPNDDWVENETEYIERIRTWIENGAPDMFGNLPEVPDLPPTVVGLVGILPSGQEPLKREGGNGEILVPLGTRQLELLFSITAENIDPSKLTSIKIRLSPDRNDFFTVEGKAVTLLGSPLQHDGFLGERVTYYHRVSLEIGDLQLGDKQYIRLYIQVPGESFPIEIPSDGSVDYVKEQFSFRIHD